MSTEFQITTDPDERYIKFYYVTPGIREWESKSLVATLSEVAVVENPSGKIYVSFTQHFDDVPCIRGAWFINKEEAEKAIEGWVNILRIISSYKRKLAEDPPF